MDPTVVGKILAHLGLLHPADSPGPALCRRLLGRPASEYGRLCHGDGAHDGGARCRRVLMLPTVQPHYLSRTGRVQVPTRGDFPFAPLA